MRKILVLLLLLALPAGAVVNATNSYVSYACDGSTANFTINYPYLNYTHLIATSTTGPGVVTTLVYTTDYTVSASSTQTTATLTILSPATKCPSGSTLLIKRSVPYTQPNSYRAQTTYNQTLHENTADLLEMQIQQINNAAFTLNVSQAATWTATQTFTCTPFICDSIVSTGGGVGGYALRAQSSPALVGQLGGSAIYALGGNGYTTGVGASTTAGGQSALFYGGTGGAATSSGTGSTGGAGATFSGGGGGSGIAAGGNGGSGADFTGGIVGSGGGSPTGGDGLRATPSGGTYPVVSGAGGNFSGYLTGSGVKAQGGATSGYGVQGIGVGTGLSYGGYFTAADGVDALVALGIGSANAIVGLGAGASIPPNTGSGVYGVGRTTLNGPGVTGLGGGASGNGVVGTGITSGSGIVGNGGTTGPGGTFNGGATSGAGGVFSGGGTSSAGATFSGGVPNGVGVSITGTGTGAGISAFGGGSSGAGATLNAGAGNADGADAFGSGTGNGVYGQGGGASGRGATFTTGNTTNPVVGTINLAPSTNTPTTPTNGDQWVDGVGFTVKTGGTNYLLSANPMLDANTAAGQSIPNATPTIVVFGTATRDTDSGLNVGTGRYTVPTSKGGDYLVMGAVAWNSSIATGTTKVQIFKNAVLVRNAYAVPSTAGPTTEISGIINCAAGDILDIRVTQSTGGAVALTSTATDNFFNLKRIP